jgi:excisionase family DNA binding protein
MNKLTEYLHTTAAAEYLGVAHNTIRKWAARGEIPMHRNPANGYRLFKRSDLDSCLSKWRRRSMRNGHLKWFRKLAPSEFWI